MREVLGKVFLSRPGYRRVVVILVFIGVFLRFYNLFWGTPYFFHPDERNIAMAVSRLRFPEQMNPGFFAYGSFPIYLTYLSGLLGNLFDQTSGGLQVTFAHAIGTGRLLSAVFSVLLIPLVGKLVQIVIPSGKKELVRLLALGAMAVAVFAPGLVQYAHFSTFETVLALEYGLFLLIIVRLARRGRWGNYLLAGAVVGFAMATKVTSAFLLLPLLIAHLMRCRRGEGQVIRRLFSGGELSKLLVALVVGALIYGVLFPYSFLDYEAFRRSMRYEGQVALGTLPVFYTAGFLRTVPFYYQLVHVLPYLLTPGLTLLGVAAWLYFTVRLMLRPRCNKDETGEIMVWFLVTVFFLSQAFMFVKWMRYMVPLIPWLIVLVTAFMYRWSVWAKGQWAKIAVSMTAGVLLLTVISGGLAFWQRYLLPDTRIAAAEWAQQNLPPASRLLTEMWDLGVLPFNDSFGVSEVRLFDTYQLDGFFGQCRPANQPSRQELERRLEAFRGQLATADYFAVLSRRVSRTRQELAECFPLGNTFYEYLAREGPGVVRVYVTPSTGTDFEWGDLLYPEETYFVFDRPRVRIYRIEDHRPLIGALFARLDNY